MTWRKKNVECVTVICLTVMIEDVLSIEKSCYALAALQGCVFMW